MTNHENRTTTYAVLNRHGDVQEDGASLATAAETVMWYDGHEYEIRPAADGKGFELWTSTYSRNSTAYNGLTKSVIYSLKKDTELAAADIYRQVVKNADWWCGCRVITDADYAAEIAEIEAQDAE